MLTFTIPGPPVGKGRPRISKVGNHARMFTPEKTVNYETLVAVSAKNAMDGKPPIDGAVRVVLDIVCQIPASWSKKKRAAALEGKEHPTSKPDIDNVIKAVFDGMNGIVWRDDVLVVDSWGYKRYGATPGVNVTVAPVECSK